MAMTIKVNGAVFEFDEVSEYLEFAEATGLEGLPEEDSSGTPIKEPLGKDANGEDLYEGDYVTGTEANPYRFTNSNAICEVESESDVKVIQTTDEDVTQYEGESFVLIDLEEFVKLSDNLDEAKEKFDEIKGVELEYSPTEFRDGDLVVIKESFRDSFGDIAETNSILPVITDGLYAVIGVGTVLIGDNLDKLQLVCRKEDRKDIEL